MLTLESGIKVLQNSGAKITSQRVAIMKALAGRSDHPSAERIFLELKPNFPTLSIATVYSTTQLLAESGVLRILTIDDKKVYFDPNTMQHGHFLCKRCKKLVDVENADLNLPGIAASCPNIASLDSSEVFLYGVCSNCAD